MIFSEGSFTYREEKDLTEHKLWIAKVVAHEIAHQWFGNTVSPLWWSDLWLSEGLSSFFEKYILDQVDL